MDLTSEQAHRVWQKLYATQFKFLTKAHGHISPLYSKGLHTIDYDPLRLPDPAQISKKLIENLSSWKLIVGDLGFVDNATWFWYLANRRLPINTRIRTLNEIDCSPEPDLFHDYFGHVPYLAVTQTANIYRVIGEAFQRAGVARKNKIAKFYYFAIEQGIILKNNRERIFGAGILSSPRHSRNILASIEHDSAMPIAIQKADLKVILKAEVSLIGEPKNVFVFENFEHIVELFKKI